MIGQNIQNYTVTAYLGEGGMGTVYRASDTMLGREVALKMLHGTLISQPQFLERFKKEARVLAQLLHPNIAVIYNFIGHDNNHFMVMEYVEGNNLDSILRKHKIFPANLVIPVFLQALEGLHHAHKKGIYHRDIKPSNLILTPDGTVKLMDFGIAKMAGEQRLTQVNRVVGTIEYMAPELIEGKDPSFASDLYATGVTMYELLTGKLPFEGNTDFTLMQDILKKRPVSVDKLNSTVPSALSAIVMKALEKKPENRYTDAKAFQLALANAFPNLKDIDTSTLHSTPAPTQNVQAITMPVKGAKPTALQMRDRKISFPGLNIDALKEKYLTREKAPLLIGGLSILLALMLLLPQMMKNKADSQKDNIISEQTPVNTADSMPVTDQLSSTISFTSTTDSARKPADFEIPVNNSPVLHETTKENGKKNENKNDSKGNTKPDSKKSGEPEKEKQDDPPPIVIAEPEKNREPVPVEPEPKPLRSVRLNSRVEVNLLLRESITQASAQEGQVLHFTVTSPVVYNGETIISKGAAATGRIKNIGKKKMSIVLINVNTTGGQSLPFETIELSGRIEDILAARHYSGTLKKGSTINF